MLCFHLSPRSRAKFQPQDQIRSSLPQQNSELNYVIIENNTKHVIALVSKRQLLVVAKPSQKVS